MKRTSQLLVLLFCAAGLTGCVERQFVIESVPPGAQVLINGELIGNTPTQDSFVYYGKYEFVLIKDGWETLRAVEHIRAPWYQYPVIDFFAENVVPWKIKDVRRLNFPMQPLRSVPPGQVLERGGQLRIQGRQLYQGQQVAEPPPTAARPAIPGDRPTPQP